MDPAEYGKFAADHTKKYPNAKHEEIFQAYMQYKQEQQQGKQAMNARLLGG